jgi:dipeptidyl aminopeptidase/acylaminoacyl peptidase
MPSGLTTAAGNPSAFSPDGKSLLLPHQDTQRPSDLWVYDLASQNPRQLSYSAVAGLNPKDLPAAQTVHYKSFDGQMISAFLWMPYNLKRDGSNRAVVLPHGGPTGQTVANFSATAAALSSRGYVCIAPNVRGSTGYGLAFQKANYQDLGGGDLQEEVYATKFLIDTGVCRCQEDRHIGPCSKRSRSMKTRYGSGCAPWVARRVLERRNTGECWMVFEKEGWARRWSLPAA